MARHPSADKDFFLTRCQVARLLGHDGTSDAARSYVRRLEGRELHPVLRAGRWRFRRSEVEALARRSDFAHAQRLTAAELEVRIIEALEQNGDDVIAVAKLLRVQLASVERVLNQMRALRARARASS